ncbi:MAG: Fe-Mn family superoxide dismutase [Rhodospirillaceae bacterium]|nr:Fe-Mn family superoxide dismutase [Rhodospirillaceae bacterium]
MTHEIGRRELMTGAAIGLMAVAARDTLAQTGPALGANYEPKPLSINPKSIRGLSEQIITSHYDNNYTGAVKRLNAINAELAKVDPATAPAFLLNGLKREQLLATNSMTLHEIYFAGLGMGGEPKGEIATALARDFGSVAAWRAEFAATGKALGGGSGWVLLTYSSRLGRLVNQWAADHSMTIADGYPVLALDMYEHAYHMDYGAKAGAYVDAFMGVINWDSVAAAYTAHRTGK